MEDRNEYFPENEDWKERWEEIKNTNKLEAPIILNEIKQTLSCVNITNLLTQLTHMSFYIREDEDIYEHNISFDLRELPIIHLICGLCLQLKESYFKPDITAEELFNLINKSKSYLFKTSPYLNNQKDDEKNNVIQGHKQTMKMIRPLNPERYPQQTELYVKYINDKVSEIFLEKCGLSPDNILNIGKKVSAYTIEKINKNIENRHKHPLIKQFINNPEDDVDLIRVMGNKTEIEREEYMGFYVKYLASLASREDLVFTIDELMQDVEFKNLEKVLVESYLSLCSSKHGDQPLESDILIDNVLYSKPIIKWRSIYYCPAPADIILSMPSILEKILEQDKLSTPPTMYWERYQKARGYFVEDKAEEYFLRIFPKSSVFKNVIYEYNGNVEEADVLIPYDDKLIIIQAKAGSLNAAARRGASKSFEKAIKKLIEDSYQQGLKVRSYLENSTDIIFKLRSNGKFAFSKNSKSRQLTDYIFINLTLEALGPLSARIKELQSFGLFKNNEYPVSMSIYDLDTITDILPPSPSIFLHYIKQRLISQDKGLFVFQDELTPFGWYLEAGSIKLPSDIDDNEITHVSIDPDYLIKFDQYYLRKGEKPILAIEDEWLKLIQHLESQSMIGHTQIAEQLLNITPVMRQRLIERIGGAFKKKYKKGIIGVVSLALINEPIGVSFVIFDTTAQELNYTLETYSLVRKYQAQKRYWIGLAKAAKSNGSWWNVTCAQYYDIPWEFDAELNSLPNIFVPKT